eukprot:GILK01006261.1.p1 GENE.GILK01006261.1~~GILK01006261.1.p1  ORF type:complete len:682 (-),score=134.55 GILK01006261.1:131-2149(-)
MSARFRTSRLRSHEVQREPVSVAVLGSPAASNIHKGGRKPQRSARLPSLRSSCSATALGAPDDLFQRGRLDGHVDDGEVEAEETFIELLETGNKDFFHSKLTTTSETHRQATEWNKMVAAQWKRQLPSRRDIHMLREWMDLELRAVAVTKHPSDPQYVADIFTLNTIIFHELLKQIAAQCAERAELLARIWQSMYSLLQQVMLQNESTQSDLVRDWTARVASLESQLESERSQFEHALRLNTVEKENLQKEVQELQSELQVRHQLVQTIDRKLQERETDIEYLLEEASHLILDIFKRDSTGDLKVDSPQQTESTEVDLDVSLGDMSMFEPTNAFHASYHDRVDSIVKKIRELDADVQKVNESIRKRESEMDGLEEEIAACEEELGLRESKLELAYPASEDFFFWTDRVSSMRSQIQSRQIKIDKIRTEIIKLRTTVSDLHQKCIGSFDSHRQRRSIATQTSSIMRDGLQDGAVADVAFEPPAEGRRASIAKFLCTGKSKYRPIVLDVSSFPPSSSMTPNDQTPKDMSTVSSTVITPANMNSPNRLTTKRSFTDVHLLQTAAEQVQRSRFQNEPIHAESGEPRHGLRTTSPGESPVPIHITRSEDPSKASFMKLPHSPTQGGSIQPLTPLRSPTTTPLARKSQVSNGNQRISDLQDYMDRFHNRQMASLAADD